MYWSRPDRDRMRDVREMGVAMSSVEIETHELARGHDPIE